jgi:hypothetical protein
MFTQAVVAAAWPGGKRALQGGFATKTESQPTAPPSPGMPGWLPFTPNPAVKHRKPEDVVGEHSAQLKIYRRNMPPRQLVFRLIKHKYVHTMQVCC